MLRASDGSYRTFRTTIRTKYPSGPSVVNVHLKCNVVFMVQQCFDALKEGRCLFDIGLLTNNLQ